MELVPGDWISDCIAFTGVYEPELSRGIAAKARRGGTFIDIGANLGYFSLVWAAGNTGNQTINKPAGTVNVAASASTVTVTNSTVTANSIVFVIARTADATCTVKNVVPASGSFVINMTASCTGETSVGFLVTN